jgi:hypothetical protein
MISVRREQGPLRWPVLKDALWLHAPRNPRTERRGGRLWSGRATQHRPGIVPADDPTDNERRRWFYNPTNHGGLTIHQQRPAQQRAAMRLVSTGLSPAAYVTVATIMGLENVLDYIEGFVVRFNRERGRDPGLYYLRVFGKPGDQGLWGWRFGGHHVSLNNLVVDGVLVATTPCFLGADPATSPLLGGAVNRPLARMEDLGRDLVRSLRPELAARTVLLPRAPSDFVTANRTLLTDGDRVIPLVGVWRDERFPDPVEQAKLQKLSDAIDQAPSATPTTPTRYGAIPPPTSVSTCSPGIVPRTTGKTRDRRKVSLCAGCVSPQPIRRESHDPAD